MEHTEETFDSVGKDIFSLPPKTDLKDLGADYLIRRASLISAVKIMLDAKEITEEQAQMLLKKYKIVEIY